MSGHHQQSRQPPPPSPQPPPYPGQQVPPAHGWIDAAGRWQPGSPPPPQPPKKSSNGLVIALVIVAALLVLGVVGAVAQSSDSSPSREDEALEELSERLDASDSDFDAIDQLTEELVADDLVGLSGLESRCIATQLVEGLGASRSLEITAADLGAGLPVAEAEEFADAYVDCVDLQAFFARTLASDPITADLPDFYVDCLFDELGDATFRAQFVAEFSGDAAPDAELEQLGAEAGDRCIAVVHARTAGRIGQQLIKATSTWRRSEFGVTSQSRAPVVLSWSLGRG